MDIEDVLSSIRRLLTEDARFAPDGELAAEVGNDGELDRLVLGPALRVPEDEIATGADVPGPDVSGLSVDNPRTEGTPLYDPADTAEDEPASMLGRMVEEELGQVFGNLSADTDDTRIEVSEEGGDTEFADATGVRADDSFAQKISALEAVISQQTPRSGWQGDLPESEGANAGYVAENVTQLHWEPEQVLHDDTPQPKAPERVDPAALAGPYTVPPEAQSLRPAQQTQGTPDTLDAEALRPLVAALLREELQGPLGERITRNVRKLVRREIQRVLMSQEFH